MASWSARLVASCSTARRLSWQRQISTPGARPLRARPQFAQGRARGDGNAGPAQASLAPVMVARRGRFLLIGEEPVAGAAAPAAFRPRVEVATCLLYTSDAADEEDSVDLG